MQDDKPISMVNAAGNEAIVGACQVAEWEARGYKIRGAKPAAPSVSFTDLVKVEWRSAFTAAGFGTLETLSRATAEQLDALPVKGLGPAKSAALVAAAKAALA